VTAKGNEFGLLVLIAAVIASWSAQQNVEPGKASNSPPTPATKTGADTSRPKAAAASGSCKLPVLGDKDLVVVASVPDPRKTHLGLLTDRYLAAIYRGVQQMGFSLNSTELQWSQPMSQAKQDCPGILHFYDHGPPSLPSRHLFILIVGETPIVGIHEPEFKKALCYATRYGRFPAVILGPSFSGSLYLLNALIDRSCCTATRAKWQRKRHDKATVSFKPDKTYPYVYVRSGTVTSESAIHFFATQANNGGNTSDYARFQTFHHSDEYQIRRFIEFMQESGISKGSGETKACGSFPRVALVSEDQTLYGALTNAPRSDPLGCLYATYFPKDIHHVRAAYEKSLREAGEKPTRGRNFRLNIDAEDQLSPEQPARAFSPKYTAISQEAVLLEIATTLRVRHVNYILVRATDPLDMLFVAQFLRRTLPEVQIVTLNSDMLFRRDADLSDLWGTLSLSTYPPIPSAHRFFNTRTERTLAIFPDSTSAGLFNATQSAVQLATELMNREAKATRSNAQTKESSNVTRMRAPAFHAYGLPCLTRTCRKKGDALVPNCNPCKATMSEPGVWITAIARDGYWPIAVLPSSAAHRDPFIAKQKTVGYEYSFVSMPVAWLLITVIVSVAACWLSTSVWLGSSAQNALYRQRFAAVQDFRSATLLATIGLTIVFSLLMLALPLSVPMARTGFPSIPILALASLAILVTTVSLTSRMWWILRCRGVALGYFAGCCVLGVVFAIVVRQLNEPARYFALYRSIHLGSGLSPALPLLLAAGALLVWAWYLLAAETVFGSRKASVPEGKFLPHARDFESIDETTKEEWIICALAMGLAVFLLLKSGFTSLEPAWFSRIFECFLVVVVFAVTHTLGRLWVVWRTCSNVLSRLQLSPVRDGIARIKGFSWKPIWDLTSSTSRARFRALSTAFVSLKRLNTCAGMSGDEAVSEPINTAYQCTAAKRDKLLESLGVPDDANQSMEELSLKQLVCSRREREISMHLSEYQRSVAKAASTVYAAILLPWWGAQTRCFALDVEVAQDSGADEQKRENGQQLIGVGRRGQHLPCIHIAQEFVALVYVHAIVRTLLHIRWKIVALGWLFALSLLAFTLYPFEPRTSVTVFFGVAFLVSAFVVVHVYAAMHRDAVLSSLTDTDAGKLGLDFWARILTAGAAPALTFVTSQFPELNFVVGNWLKPLINKLS